MNRKQLLIVIGVILITVPLIGVTVYVLSKPTNTNSNAAVPTINPLLTTTPPATQTTTTNQASQSANTADNTSTNSADLSQQAQCTAPGQVQNVKVNYPNCQ